MGIEQQAPAKSFPLDRTIEITNWLVDAGKCGLCAKDP